MLRELSVQNLALIEDVRVELEPGFCAWTGETGAGKTLLLHALGLLLGERGSSEFIRDGADEVRIVGRFQLTKPALRQSVEGILHRSLEDDQLLLLRRLNRQGRNFAYVNDEPATLATLKLLGPFLVDMHGQRESQVLLESSNQLMMLDAFGGLELARSAYVQAAEVVRDLRQRLLSLDADRQLRLRERQLARFEREELVNAQLTPGELDELTREREILVHARGLFEFALNAVHRLYEDDGSAYEVLCKIEREAEHYAKIDPDLEPLAQRLETLVGETQDLVRAFRPWSQTLKADPGRIDELENRIQLLRRLESKYGQRIDDLLGYRDSLIRQEAEQAELEHGRAEWEASLTRAFQKLRSAGEMLSKERGRVARRFAAEVQKELTDLGMPDARLEASLEPRPLGTDPLSAEVPAFGFEHLELMLQANPGEPARPLRKVASGGEMSGTMLAIKSVLAGQDHVGTMIFDEIDANVGGRLGDVLGTKLAKLGKTHQVISVTHLPQVASYAPHQWTIRKSKKGKRTTTTIESLSARARLEELAHMLRGASRSETTRKEAESMLHAARKRW